MFIVKQLKRNFTYLLCNYETAPEYVGGSGKGDDGKTSKEIQETIKLPSLEQQKIFIKDILEKNKVVSLDDNPELKQKILDGLDPTKPEEQLTTEQINTVFRELAVIHKVESDIITPDVIRDIEQKVAEERFIKNSRKVQKMYLQNTIKECVEDKEWYEKYENEYDFLSLKDDIKDAIQRIKDAEEKLNKMFGIRKLDLN